MNHWCKKYLNVPSEDDHDDDDSWIIDAEENMIDEAEDDENLPLRRVSTSDIHSIESFTSPAYESLDQDSSLSPASLWSILKGENSFSVGSPQKEDTLSIQVSFPTYENLEQAEAINPANLGCIHQSGKDVAEKQRSALDASSIVAREKIAHFITTGFNAFAVTESYEAKSEIQQDCRLCPANLWGILQSEHCPANLWGTLRPRIETGRKTRHQVEADGAKMPPSQPDDKNTTFGNRHPDGIQSSALVILDPRAIQRRSNINSLPQQSASSPDFIDRFDETTDSSDDNENKSSDDSNNSTLERFDETADSSHDKHNESSVDSENKTPETAGEYRITRCRRG